MQSVLFLLIQYHKIQISLIKILPSAADPVLKILKVFKRSSIICFVNEFGTITSTLVEIRIMEYLFPEYMHQLGQTRYCFSFCSAFSLHFIEHNTTNFMIINNTIYQKIACMEYYID
jgi:hypothetical protein